MYVAFANGEKKGSRLNTKWEPEIAIKQFKGGGEEEKGKKEEGEKEGVKMKKKKEGSFQQCGTDRKAK